MVRRFLNDVIINLSWAKKLLYLFPLCKMSAEKRHELDNRLSKAPWVRHLQRDTC
jgi:hypothetical protein